MSTVTITSTGCSVLTKVETITSAKKVTANQQIFVNQSSSGTMAVPEIISPIGQGFRGIPSNWYRWNELDDLLSLAEPGDLLEIRRVWGFYSHWVVYAGRNELMEATVVHFSKENFSSQQLLAGAGIQFGILLNVLGCGWVRINNAHEDRYSLPRNNNEINDRIANFVPENYGLVWDLFECNCEHFANYCRYNARISGQSKPWLSAMNGLSVVREDCETSILRLREKALETRFLVGTASIFELIGIASIFLHAAASVIMPVFKTPFLFNLKGLTASFGLIGGYSASRFIGLILSFVCLLMSLWFLLERTDSHSAFEYLEKVVEWKLRGLASVFALTGGASFFGLTGVASLFGILSVVTLFQVIGAYLLVLLSSFYKVFGVASVTTVFNHRDADILYEQDAENECQRPVFGLADVAALFQLKEKHEEFGLTKMLSGFVIVSAVSTALLWYVIFTFGMSGVISVFALIGATSFLGFTGFNSLVGLIGVVATFAVMNVSCVFGLIGLFCLFKKLKIEGVRVDCTFLFDLVVFRSVFEWIMLSFLFVLGPLASHYNLSGGYSVCKIIHFLLQLKVFLKVIYLSDPTDTTLLCFLVTAITVVAAVGLGKGTLRKLRQMQREARVQQQLFIQARIAELET